MREFFAFALTEIDFRFDKTVARNAKWHSNMK